MKIAMTALAVTAGALVAAGALGVADAEAPVVSPTRTVSVQGVATVPVAQSANAATATAAYRVGMAAAIADGQSKAEFLAGKAGATLGGVQGIAENGGYISCQASEEAGGGEYLGEQPDFGSSGGSVSPVRVSAPAKKAPAKPRRTTSRPRKSPAAKKASVTTCTLSTQVALVYAIS